MARTGRLANLKNFPKGVSGNPSGKPKDIDAFRAGCRAHTQEALALLARAVRMKRVTANGVRAAEIILNHGWGRPPVALELSGDVNVNVPALLDEARERMTAMLEAKAEETTLN